jgi:hypothetical protein
MGLKISTRRSSAARGSSKCTGKHKENRVSTSSSGGDRGCDKIVPTHKEKRISHDDSDRQGAAVYARVVRGDAFAAWALERAEGIFDNLEEATTEDFVNMLVRPFTENGIATKVGEQRKSSSRQSKRLSSSSSSSSAKRESKDKHKSSSVRHPHSSASDKVNKNALGCNCTANHFRMGSHSQYTQATNLSVVFVTCSTT